MVISFLNRWNRNALKMVWRVSKNGHVSYLVGTAHWFPYSFHSSLISLFRKVRTTVFEGPLDDESMNRVSEYGMHPDGGQSIDGLIDPEATEHLNFILRQRLLEEGNGDLSVFFQKEDQQHYRSMIEGRRPWMAFFSIWSFYLGWKYSVDLEAYHLACRMRKKIHFLETIEEQLSVLDNIPLERFIGHLNDVENWSVYQRKYVTAYLDGNLDQLLGLSNKFPTRTPVVLSERDQVLFERMSKYIQDEPAVVFLGLSHVPGVSRLLLEQGYNVLQGMA